MKLLITGASSYVGAKIYDDLKDIYEVVGTYHTNKLFKDLISLDITREPDVFDIVQNFRPDYIIHVAANASSIWCENNPTDATTLNQQATKHLVDAANNNNSKMIYISSFAVMNPTNSYGKTKYNSEALVHQVKSGFIILRPSLIVGYSPNTHNDRPFNRLLKHIRENSEASYDTSWKFQPTYLRHISEIIQKIIESNIFNEIIPIATPEIKSRFDLAKDILTPFNITVNSEDKKDTSPTFSEDLSKLKKLDLPEYTYKEMIRNIIEEIKERENTAPLPLK
jgi:dTDP-4-dehydrorhamnose reductase